MKLFYSRQRTRRFRFLTMFAALMIGTGGCAIDGDQLITDVIQAALDSATGSLVDSLSGHLARN